MSVTKLNAGSSTFRMFEGQISSLSYSQSEIIADIMHLYTSGKIDCDPCFNRGTMYGGLTTPVLKFDIKPIAPGVVQADARNLPLTAGEIESMIIDPPFLIGTSSNKMSDRFGSYPTLYMLQDAYNEFLCEAFRVLSTNGILIFKLQDQIHDRRKYFISHFVINQAHSIGFNIIDEFILLNKARISSDQGKQAASRVFHSKFLVFRKQRGRRKYILEQKGGSHV